MSEPSRKRGLPVRVKMRHDTHFVEELTARHETTVGKMVPLSTVETDCITTCAQGAALVEAVGHPNFVLHLDV